MDWVPPALSPSRTMRSFSPTRMAALAPSFHAVRNAWAWHSHFSFTPPSSQRSASFSAACASPRCCSSRHSWPNVSIWAWHLLTNASHWLRAVLSSPCSASRSRRMASCSCCASSRRRSASRRLVSISLSSAKSRSSQLQRIAASLLAASSGSVLTALPPPSCWPSSTLAAAASTSACTTRSPIRASRSMLGSRCIRACSSCRRERQGRRGSPRRTEGGGGSYVDPVTAGSTGSARRNAARADCGRVRNAGCGGLCIEGRDELCAHELDAGATRAAGSGGSETGGSEGVDSQEGCEHRKEEREGEATNDGTAVEGVAGTTACECGSWPPACNGAGKAACRPNGGGPHCSSL
mmetsp:Transcript_8911/g.27662  ORF Transcript_8911/g.27662 Transcript_8911/m.27662 type:complete len:351 (+) Transcript_8911:492-1544(+)